MTTFVALELPARFGDVRGSLARLDAALAAARADAARVGERVDVAVAPEACLTGYVSPGGDFDLARFAEPAGGPTERALAALAGAHSLTLVAPLVERDGARVFNACAAFGPDGAALARYRKRHPWIPETWASPGDLPYPLFAAGGLRATIAICFDAHFLEDEAAEALSAADVLLFPSAWVDDAGDDARAAIFTRLARRFGVAIVNANWGPGDVRVRGQGGSRIVGADGRAQGTRSADGARAALRARR